MARQSSSGAGGAVAGLIVFAFLFVITLVVMIIYMTRADDAQKKLAEAESRLARYASSNDMDNAEVVALSPTERSTAISQLLGRIQDLRRVITGDQNKGMEEIQIMVADLAERTPANAKPDIGGLVNTSNVLLENFNKANQEIQTLTRQIEEVNTELTAQVTANSELGTQYNENVAALESQLAEVRDLAERYKQVAEGRIEELGVNFEGVRTGVAGQIQEYEDRIAQMSSTIRDLENKLRQADEQGDKLAPEAWRQADGEIAAIMEQSDYVQINLGSAHKLHPGTTFTVFDKATGVEADERLSAGKAKIEVITVNENASIARVVELQRGKALQPGDLIANVVYDPNTTPKFYVFGDFDLNNSGTPSLSDKRRVEGMILRWDGVLAEDLSPDVDYLVLGVEPDLPQQVSPDELDPLVIAAAEASQRKYERYFDLVSQASRLSIPVLNQNRFLFLVGYYRR